VLRKGGGDRARNMKEPDSRSWSGVIATVAGVLSVGAWILGDVYPNPEATPQLLNWIFGVAGLLFFVGFALASAVAWAIIAHYGLASENFNHVMRTTERPQDQSFWSSHGCSLSIMLGSVMLSMQPCV
jgi:uncharacterized membrane protein HdeD (DUF308 family)